jgi:hypothetical protein
MYICILKARKKDITKFKNQLCILYQFMEFIKQDLKGTPTESLEFIKPFERHTNQITGIYQTISQVQLYCNVAKNQSLCYH